MSAKKRGWRRPLRWARNILLGVVGLVTVLVLGAFLFFETSYGKGVLRNQIQARMADTFIGGATLGRIEGNPFTEIVLVDVVVNDASKQPAIKVKRLTVKMPLMPLISRQLRVDKIIADELDILVRKEADGSINLANLTSPSEPSTWSIRLPNVEVHKGHLRLELGGEPIDLDNLEVVVDAALPFAGPVDATAALSADWRQKKMPLDMAASIHLGPELTRISSATVQLADIDIAITELQLKRDAFATPISGVVSVYAPDGTMRAVAPQIELPPGDLALLITADAEGRLTRLTANIALGKARAKIYGDVDIQAMLARGIVMAEDLDLTALTRGEIDGHGGALVAFDIDGNDAASEFPSANAMINVWGKVGTAPTTHAVIAVVAGGDRVAATVSATSDTGLRAAADAAIRKHGDRITLEHSTVIASTGDARRASQGLVPVGGAIDAKINASGALAPRMDLAVNGHANGRRLRVSGVTAQSFKFRVDARHVPSNPVGTARLEAANVQRGAMSFRKLTVAAGNRPDGKLQVSVRTQPKPSPWLVDVDALITTGDTMTVDLQRHFVRAAGGSVWKGDSGTLVVTPREVTLTGFTSHSGDGKISADATFVRAGRNAGDLTAKLDANIDLTNFQKMYRGKIVAHVDVARTRGKLVGTIDAKATALAFNPVMPGTFDATLKVDAKAGQFLAHLDVGTPTAGQARVDLDVNAPADVADAKAWRKLGRDSIRKAELTLKGVDLEEAAKLVGAEPMKGTIDGQIKLTPNQVGGDISVRGVELRQTKDLGTIEADIHVSDAGNGELKTSVIARLKPTAGAVTARDVTNDGAARFLAEVRFATPDKLFDMAAWDRLGARAFKGGSVKAERLAFQPGTLERFGIVSDMRGELAVGAELEEGMKTARFALNVYNLRGGVFAEPIVVNISGVLDDKSTRVIASVVGKNVTLLRVSVKLPMTLDEIRRNPAAAKAAPIAATATIDRVPAKVLMNVLGTSQITGGVLDGKIEIGGTVARPTMVTQIVARDVTVPKESGRQTQGIKLLTIDASWDGTAGKVAIDGVQTGAGKLKIRATGSPSDLGAATAHLEAAKLDIAPLVAFMPGPAGALGGELNANFTLRGADPRTADLSGKLHITNGRIPLAPAVGTLFKGDLKLAVHNRVLDLDLSGKLGRGDIRLQANAPFEGATPKGGKLTLTLRKVQLIGTTEPIITGVVTADIARVDEVWRADVLVNRVNIKVPKTKGTKLSPVGAPKDLVYGGETLHHGKNKGLDVPAGKVHSHSGIETHGEDPAATGMPRGGTVASIKVKISNVFIEAEEARGLLAGNLKIDVDDTAEVGVVGRVSLSRAVLDLFSRRYQVDKAVLQFDGSMDPMLDVRVTYDFPEVTTITEVRGRMSKPDLYLSSNPGTYTQAELLGFLLGGEPGGDPENAPSAGARVAGAGASVLSGALSGAVKKALPVDIDVLRYEAASANSSAAITVGTWITDTLFLAYRQHLEARPDENTGEAELEYWIRRRLVLEATTGDRGVSGLDLLWRRRW